jgi:hypothetical protein
MKKLALLFVLSFCVNSVFADNLFQNSNPFPQTSPERMNNLYEAEQSTLLQEAKQEKKSWFRKGKNIKEQEIKDTEKRLYTYPPNTGVNEGIQDGSFFMFQ